MNVSHQSSNHRWFTSLILFIRLASSYFSPEKKKKTPIKCLFPTSPNVCQWLTLKLVAYKMGYSVSNQGLRELSTHQLNHCLETKKKKTNFLRLSKKTP